MKLTEIGVPQFTCNCYKCGRHLKDGPIYADLDGPAYRAYYCPECAKELASKHRREVGTAVNAT